MDHQMHVVRALLLTALLPLSFLFTETAAIAGAAVESDPFYRKLQGIWQGVRLSRDLAYWRAPERTPGGDSNTSPDAANLWVGCDRWPDGSDPRRFGLDAIRLSGARTDHEKALAVYRWVRRWMIYNNKNGSSTEHLNPGPVGHPWVHQADKLLNVYGVHWCGGQARVVEQVWRALGFRAEKVIRGGHTIVGMHYRDFDGIERWHGLDVSHSAVAWHDSYQRLLSLDELSTQWYAFYYQYGLPGNGHIYFNDHRMELALRRGEQLERLWGNVGKPYQDNAASGRGMAERVPEAERGPYLPFTYGNGIWRYAPDLEGGEWQKGLAGLPVQMAAGRLQPAKAGRAATAVWAFNTPYIISDAEVRLDLFRRGAGDTIRLHVSIDDGATWAPVWECPPDLVGLQTVTVPICPKFEVSEKGPPPPKDFVSPFGRYRYRLKLELLAETAAEDCRVTDISFENTVQLNLYSLPQLHPGKNVIKVRGDIAPGAALKVVYRWDDAAGKEHQNVQLVTKTPFQYEIHTQGQKWEEIVCRSITVAAVDAPAGAEPVTAAEADSASGTVSLLPPVEETTGRWNGQPLKKNLPSLGEVLKATRDPKHFKRVLRGAVMLADPRTFDAFEALAYGEAAPNDKLLAFVGMYRADPEKARPVLLDILDDRDGLRVVWSKGKDREDVGWGREQSWCVGGTVIGYIAAEAHWPEFLPGMLKLLQSDQCKPGWGPRYGTVRVIGRLGKGSSEAREAIRNVLEHKYGKEHGDTLVCAALAAGLLQDEGSIPALRKCLESGYWPLKHHAALSLAMLGDAGIVPRMLEWLTAPFDENFRGYAAEALGHLKAENTLSALEAALAVEPLPWVREKMNWAIDEIGAP